MDLAPAERGVAALARSERIDGAARKLQELLARLWRGARGRRVKDVLNGLPLGHPLHPALTDLPLGAWCAAATLDLLGRASGRDLDRAASAALSLGVAGAAASALTGLADWSDTAGEARSVGLVHASVNTLALALEIASLWGRRRGLRGARALSAAGLAAALAGAYLGGDLVFRLGTQVDRTAHERGPRRFVAALPEADLPADQPSRIRVDGSAVLLVRQGGAIFALSDVCAHAGCSLAQGQLQDGAIVCACHGSTFRLRDGAVLHGPSPFRQPAFDVRIERGVVEVRRRERGRRG